MLISLYINSIYTEERIIESLHQFVENPYPVSISNIKQNRRGYKKRIIDIEKNLYFSLRKINSLCRIETLIESIINDSGNELWYGAQLFKKNVWIREKITPVGRIDGLNVKEKRIVELKFVLGWKSALGQIISYGYFYPTFQKEIWLLVDKKISNKDKDLIREICWSFSVLVEFIDI